MCGEDQDKKKSLAFSGSGRAMILQGEDGLGGRDTATHEVAMSRQEEEERLGNS